MRPRPLALTIWASGMDSIHIESDDHITDHQGRKLTISEARRVILAQSVPYVTVHTKMTRVKRSPEWSPGEEALPEEFRGPPDRYREEVGATRRFTVDIPTRGTVVGTEWDEEVE